MRTAVESLLPDGCPFVIGGGLVRDGILGGRPGDIDVWLPSNITIPDATRFAEFIRSLQPQAEVNLVFSGPGANVETGGWGRVEAAPAADSEYGDVNNHWVFELNYDDMPKVNFMRSMTPWTDDTQAFFNGLMRAFDIDQCMYFIGYMPGQQSVNSVILPVHLAEMYVRTSRSGRADWNSVVEGRDFRLNELYWNQYRLNTTSQARIDARVAKMCGKYAFRARTMAEIISRGNMLRTEEIVATAIPLSIVMRCVNRNQGMGLLPLPTRQNRIEPPWAAPAGVVPWTQAAFPQ